MSTYIPQITYPAAAPTTTVNFTLPPLKKPGPYGIMDQEGVGTASLTVSGRKQVMWWRTDEFFHLVFDDMPWADMAMWQAFIDYGLQGGSFLYYPDATDLTTYDEYWLEDSGGSVRNQSSGSQLDAWNPTMGDRQHATYELVLRKVPGGISSGASAPSGSIVTVGGGVPAPPGSVVTVTPTPTGTPPVPPGGGATEDIVNWVIMGNSGVGGSPNRTTQHLEGVNEKGAKTIYYAYYDNTSGSVDKIWQIKNTVMNPWDVLPIDSSYLYHWITEFAKGWSIANDFKRINRAPGYPTPEGVPVMPRFFAPGSVGNPSAVTINSPKPNPQNDFISCTSQPAIELGDFQGVTSGLYSRNFGGDLGAANYILVTVYRGTFGNFKVRENFQYVKNWGFVYWESQSLIGGVWITTQWSLHNTIHSGGSSGPNFPCMYSFPWWL